MPKGSLFGTSGIRGDEKKLFTNQFCFDIGIAFAKFLDKHQQVGPIAIGMDPRGSSPRILGAVEQGLASAGRIILDQGASPVPAINYYLIASNIAGSIMVTGSHITPGLNGVKFFAFKEEVSKKYEKEITQIYEENKKGVAYKRKQIRVSEENNANNAYEEMLVGLASSYPHWRIILDPGNGAQSDLIARVLSRLGVEVITINDELQGGFISRDTETEGVFKPLSEKVIKEKVNFGVAFDCDGDRVIFVDNDGQIIPGDYTGSLIAKYGETKTIVTPINTSQVVEYLEKPVIRTRVGSPYVIEAMKKYGAKFGFEANGGGISEEIMMSRDGGSTMIKILNLMAQKKRGLKELVRELPRFYLWRLKVNCPPFLNSKIISKAKEKFKGIRTEELDGLKIWLDKTTWILFRPSNNAPEFRVFAEAKAAETARKLSESGIQLVKEVIKNE